jgi:hypothetical protein
MKPDHRIIYFGCIGEPGHYLWETEHLKAANEPFRDIKSINQNLFRHYGGIFDGSFNPPGSGYRESTIPPLRIVAWTDNSVDHRPGSISCLIGYGYESAEEILNDAPNWFPSVMKRQAMPQPEQL